MTDPEVPSSAPAEVPKSLTREELRAQINKAQTEQEHGKLADAVVKSGSEKNLDADGLKVWSTKLQELKTETMKQFNEGVGVETKTVIEAAEKNPNAIESNLAILSKRLQFLMELSKVAPETSSEIPTAEHFLERNFNKGKEAIVKLFSGSKNATGLMMAAAIGKLPLSTISTFIDQVTISIAKQMIDVPFIGNYAKNFIATKEKKIAVREISDLIKQANKPGQKPTIVFDEKVTDVELATINSETFKKSAAQLIVDCQKFKNLPTITLTIADFANPSAFLNAKRMENATPEEKAKDAAISKEITDKSDIASLGAVTLNTRNETSAMKANGKWNISVDASQFTNGVANTASQAAGLKAALDTINQADSIRMIDAGKPTELAWKPTKEIRIPTNLSVDMLKQIDALFDKQIHTGITTLRITSTAESPGPNIVKLEKPTTLVADAAIPPAAFATFFNVDLNNPTNKWEYKSASWTAVAPAIPATATPKP